MFFARVSVKIIACSNLQQAIKLTPATQLVEFIKLKQVDRIQVGVLDYLVSSHQVELIAAKTNGPASKLIFEQLQNLHSLYKSRPHFGPESCDECRAYMGLLRPVENFEDFIANELGLFGPAASLAPAAAANLLDSSNNIKLINEPPSAAEVLASLKNPDRFVRAANLASFPGSLGGGGGGDQLDGKQEAERARMLAIMEQSERDLKRYSSNLASYLNERPIDRDAEIIYSEGECHN